MKGDCYPFQLGRFQCFSLCDGEMDYKLEVMVRNAPPADIAAALQAHDLPTEVITTPYAYLYVRTGRHNVLVDMGAGDLAASTGGLLVSLAAAGGKPEEIDAVFITHAHPDHVGSALNATGELNFPNAEYFIAKAEWDFWFSDAALQHPGQWFTDYARQHLSPLRGRVTLLEREEEVLPGVSVLFAPGHTPGHMVVSAASDGERLLYTGDTVLHPLHLEHPDWLPIFDLRPEAAAASKERVFALAAATGSWVLAQHFPPFPNLGHVVQREVGWAWQPVAPESPGRARVPSA